VSVDKLGRAVRQRSDPRPLNPLIADWDEAPHDKLLARSAEHGGRFSALKCDERVGVTGLQPHAHSGRFLEHEASFLEVSVAEVNAHELVLSGARDQRAVGVELELGARGLCERGAADRRLLGGGCSTWRMRPTRLACTRSCAG
jgi:hypothetical protein